MLAIIWHSRTGAARAMARAVHAGALEQAGHEAVRLIAAEETAVQDLLDADAYVFVCPENLAAMTGAMKEMFDRAYYGVLGRIEGRPYATAIAAGSDGAGAQAQIDRIATGWRLKRAAEPIILNLGVQTPEAILAEKHLSPRQLAGCRELGEALAAGLEMGIF